MVENSSTNQWVNLGSNKQKSQVYMLGWFEDGCIIF